MAYQLQQWPEPPDPSAKEEERFAAWFGPRKITLCMVANRSEIPKGVKLAMLGLGIIMIPILIRLAVLGAWPILILLVVVIGLLAFALWGFRRATPPGEILTFENGEIAHIRNNGKDDVTEIRLPAHWTKLAVNGSAGSADLVLVFRDRHHPVGQCLSVAERLEVADIIREILAAA